jgi:hypothetical protein
MKSPLAAAPPCSVAARTTAVQQLLLRLHAGLGELRAVRLADTFDVGQLPGAIRAVGRRGALAGQSLAASQFVARVHRQAINRQHL